MNVGVPVTPIMIRRAKGTILYVRSSFPAALSAFAACCGLAADLDPQSLFAGRQRPRNPGLYQWSDVVHPRSLAPRDRRGRLEPSRDPRPPPLVLYLRTRRRSRRPLDVPHT